MPKRPSYKDIAEQAGVSQMTVSLSFRNSPTIRPETRDRVLAAAEELGYRPDPQVHRLLNYIRDRQERAITTSLACLNFFPSPQSFVNSPFRQVLWQGMKERAEALGYHIDLINVAAEKIQPERLKGILEARSISGMILPTAPEPVADHSWILDCAAIVSTSYLFDALPIDRVHFNAHRMVQLVLEKCAAAGKHRIGIAIQSDQDAHSSGEWLAAFLRGQFDLPKSEQVPPLVQKRITDTHLRMWLSRHKPEVVVAPDNHLWQRLQEIAPRGECPAFITLNWSSRAPHCAGVTANPDLIGSAAIDLLTAHVQRNERGQPANRKSVTVEPSWHDGKTF